MPNLVRAIANWTGFPGAPGYSVFHAMNVSADPQAEAQALSTAVRTLMNSFLSNLPSVITIAMDPEVQVIDEATDTLLNVVTTTPGASLTGTATGGFSGATGAVINWSTSTIRNGRRMRGRTFLVPLSSSSFDNAGSLFGTLPGNITAAATTYWQTPEITPVVYGRPTQLGTDGVSGPITAGRCPDLSAVLRSRRD